MVFINTVIMLNTLVENSEEKNIYIFIDGPPSLNKINE